MSVTDTVIVRRGWLDDLRRQWHHYTLLIVLLAILAALMIYPIIKVVGDAFIDRGAPSLVWIKAVLYDDVFRLQLFNSLALAFVVTLGANCIAMPLALLSYKYDFKGKAFLSALVLVPLVLPPFVGAIGMKQLLGKFGSFTVLCQELGFLAPHEGVNWLGMGGFWALAILVTLGLYPIAYLNLQASLANIDPAMNEAAQNLGGSRFTNFRRITLPLAMPGIFAGSTIIFIWAFTELGTPLLLNYPHVVSRAIYDEVASAQAGQTAMGSARTVIVLLIAIVAYLVGKVTLGRQAHAMTSKAAVAATTTKVGWFGSLLVALPFLIVSFFAMLPHIGVVLYSFTATAVESAVGWGPDNTFGWYRTILPNRFTLNGYHAVFTTPEIYNGILNSLKYASVSTVVDIVLGISIAWVLIRTRVVGRTLLDAMAMLPLAVPGLVMAFGYVAAVPDLVNVINGLFGTSLEPKDLFHAPFILLVIAYSMRRLPYLVRSAAGGLQQTSVSLEEAAQNMGASPLKTILKITVPLILANLIAGSLLTFSFAMLEVSDSLILAKLPEHYPITKTIFALGNDTSGPENVRNACALGVLAMGLLIVTILTAGTLMGKKLGAIFRA